jgi:hypothetical protein
MVELTNESTNKYVLTYKFGIGFNEYGSEETWRDTLYVLPISGSTPVS